MTDRSGGAESEKCPECSVYVRPQHSRCPLCGHALTGGGRDESEYPSYSEHGKRRRMLKKALLYGMLVVWAVSVAVNLLTVSLVNRYWCAVVCTATFWAYITVRNTLLSKTLAGTRVFLQLIAIAGVVVSVDFVFGFRLWSVDYVLPFLCMGTTLVLDIFAAVHRARFPDYVWFLLAALLVSLCPLVIFLFRLSSVLWPSIAAALFAGLSFAGLIIFADKRLKTELKKRFHW